MKSYRKEDHTPESWARYLEQQRAKRARQRERGHKPASMQPEVLNQRQREWRERHKDTERYRFKAAEAHRRYREKSPEKIREKKRQWKRDNPDKIKAWNQRYRERKKLGLVTKREPGMTGERIWQLTLHALRGKYDESTRMDIAGEAMLAFLEGDAASIKDAVALGMKRHWRMFSKFTTHSLDAEIAEGLRLIDLIDSEHERA